MSRYQELYRMQDIAKRIAVELAVAPEQTKAAIQLLDEGATVPFIARYRKEVTQGLDDTQLRNLQERLLYLRELEERRETILKSITEQNKLTPELQAQILEADSKVRLEDLYRPYKPKRRTKGQIAIEAGLEGLADGLFNDPSLSPEQTALSYVDAEKGVKDTKEALEGARYILMERFADDADLLGKCRAYIEEHALLQSKVIEGKETQAQKFLDYFAHSEVWKKVPSHRALAMFRGKREGFLQLALILPEEIENPQAICAPQQMVANQFQIAAKGRAADAWLQEVVRFTWRVKIQTHLETELLTALREKAEEEAIGVFKHNLHDLLMAPPAGAQATLGLDPGIRTGVKVAVVDANGKLLATETIYPHVPRQEWKQSLAVLHKLISEHQIKLVSIGNGTASRETEKLVEDYCKLFPDQKITKVVTSEAGASVYSASELAAKEFPDLDVSLRGAVSIARRIQDPLAELVKIEPKAIGVGQYQHDVNQTKLARTLDTVVEDAVNAVGVDLNTASLPLLTHVAGLNQQIASNIIQFRDQKGSFKNRSQLKEVPRLGDKAFEQAAGFLRIMDGDNPLDASAVHPESYPIVQSILNKSGRELKDIIGNASFLHSVNPKEFVNDQIGLPTIVDILKELEKPGRDPRASFRTAQFQEGVETLDDLKPGMILEGIITNVANFGAFVDIGVHQDGLVHISALSNEFIKDPRDVVKAGQIVKVKVLEVDKPRQRISLTMRMEDKPSSTQAKPAHNTKVKTQHKSKPVEQTGSLGLALQAAFNKPNKVK
ncbi:RNA-binding transcriptional accessory protein [Candidatus Berkiella aquae]|uniref:RNA-binding transcriptional accessory protein n=2 Tax=Candidatus Berkiella aquae TaxID=295108 RepID=A0AAE3HY63_9GAMM|nr:RNA-binding transcriptional accessory protein [Candidatus Berkiella aquae]